MNTENAVPQVNGGPRKEVSKSSVEVTRVYSNDYQKPGTLTAELKQEVITHSFYPSKKIDSNTIFSASEFGFEEQLFISKETRMAWILVPQIIGGIPTTVEMVKAQLAKIKNPDIYRVMSNSPILDDNQKYAVASGIRSVNDFANKQVSRYGENAKDGKGNDVSGKLILDKENRVQYRRTFFQAQKTEDIDLRGKSDVYLTPEIAAELEGASVLVGQTI